MEVVALAQTDAAIEGDRGGSAVQTPRGAAMRKARNTWPYPHTHTADPPARPATPSLRDICHTVGAALGPLPPATKTSLIQESKNTQFRYADAP